MSGKSPKVDEFFRNVKQWRKEFEKLRSIVLTFELTEDLKWGWPCYAFRGKNTVLMHGFKKYCALLFFKGALLKDAEGILARPGENAQSSRQMRFTSVREIVETEPVVKAYIREAIEAERAGRKVKLKTTAEFKVPEEFQRQLNQTPALKAAFEALTPGRQRAYLLHFAQPKQSKTRESRVQKCIKQILGGKGLND